MNCKILFLVLFATVVVSAVKRSYENYKVYKVVPKTKDEVKILLDLQNSGVGEFWVEHFDVSHDVRITVSPENQAVFLQRTRNASVESKELIADVQKLIDEQLAPAGSNARNTESFLSMTWDRYHDLDQIYNWLDELETTYPNVVEIVNMGLSNENREIKGIKINYNPQRNGTVIGVLEGTLHAREWISPATVTWIIKEFLTSTDPAVRALAENLEWHIFPVVNPDGYVYSFTDNRMWRKNRNTDYGTTCAPGVNDDMSNGVDLNRNFDLFWMSVGASNDPCTNTYAGPVAFSEPESRAIAQYVRNLKNQGEIIYYLAFHSYTQLVVIPYSHIAGGTDVLLANNYANMYEIAIRAAHKLEKRFGTQYRVGVAADVLYPMSGTSFDWVKYEADVPVSWLLELRDLGEYGFLLPPEQIIPNNLEIMDFLLEMDRTTRVLGYYSTGSISVLYSVTTVVFGILFVVLFN